MTLKRIWQERAVALFKESVLKPEPELSRARLDYHAAFNRLSKLRVTGDTHVYVCFNDDTSYTVCRRYTGTWRSCVAMELARCAAIVCPTEDPITLATPGPGLSLANCELAQQVCDDCAIILDAELFGDSGKEELCFSLDNRILWRDIYRGGIAEAIGHNNLGDLP